jgi:hypothetical protein
MQEVRLNKVSGAMETIKCRGEEAVSIAEGPDFESAMLHTTLTGLQPDERLCTNFDSGDSPAQYLGRFWFIVLL